MKIESNDLITACDGSIQQPYIALASHNHFDDFVTYLLEGDMKIISDSSDYNPIQCIMSCTFCVLDAYQSCAMIRRCIHKKLMQDKDHPELFV